MRFPADIPGFDDGVEQRRVICCFDQCCSSHRRALGAGWPSEWCHTAVALSISRAPLQRTQCFPFPSQVPACPTSNPAPGAGFHCCNPACARGRFGRKAMLQLSLVCSVVFGMLSAASVSYSMLAITRTLTGVALSGVSLIVLPLGKYIGVWGCPVAQGDLSNRQGRASTGA